MTVPAPSICYTADSDSVIAHGIEYTSEQLDEILCGKVKDILLDTSGEQEFAAILEGVATTEFSSENIQSLLSNGSEFEDWFVGEAIAEAVLTENHECEYPWPTCRDLKNPNASPAGCDLTGLQLTEDTVNPYRFSFGEVKTSRDANAPPSVMYSLSKQLFGLRDNEDTKRHLVRYLALHSVEKPWQHKFKSAVTRYISSCNTDIAIFGVLVRDTPPNDSDLKDKAIALATDCPAATNIVLIALYLPLASIPTLPANVQSFIDSGTPP